MFALAAILCSVAVQPAMPPLSSPPAIIARSPPAVPPLNVPASQQADPFAPTQPIALSPTAEPSRWSLSFETSYLFATTQNPFLFLVKTRYEGPNILHYRLATQILDARYRITDTGGWSILRGNLDGSLGLMYSAILHGPESYIVGIIGGFRYNFVPRDARWSPYVEMRFALSETNASHIFMGQQQDLTFGYLLGAGIGYQVNPRWRITLGTINQHESDLFMTYPNYGFNVMGASLGIERRF